MFFVLQKIHIKQSPNGIKWTEIIFGIFGKYGKKTPRETVPEGGTRQGRAPDPRGPLIRRLLLFFCRKKAIFQEKNLGKDLSPIRVTDPRKIRHDFRPDLGYAKQKRIEREVQSRRGSRPSAAMEAMDQRGNSPPI